MTITTKFKKLTAVALSILAILAIPATPASADDGVEVSISPIIEKAALVPGESYSSSFKITVNAESVGDFKYKVYATPMSVTNNNYEAFNYTDNLPNTKISEWITFEDGADSGIVKAGTTQLIKYTINVPKDASPGGQYAAIMVQDDSGEQSTSSGGLSLGTEYRLAYSIYATVAGDFKEAGTIKENNINTFFLDSKISGTSIVENTGNVHSDATYTLRVFPLFSNEEVYTNEENPSTWLIMPNTSRFISTTWDGTPSIGIYTVEQEVKFLDQVSKTSKLVVVCPIWLLLAIVFVIVFWVIWLVMRSKNRKAAAKKSGKSTSTTSSTSATKPADKPEKSESPTHSEKSE